MGFLLIHGVASFPQLDHERTLVDFLVQPRSEFVQHSHRGANNFPPQILVNHGRLIRVDPCHPREIRLQQIGK